MIPEWPWWRKTWVRIFCLFIAAEVIIIAFGIVPPSRIVFCGFGILLFMGLAGELSKQRQIRKHNDQLRARWEAAKREGWAEMRMSGEPVTLINIRKVDDDGK